ncbi:hypothetical protein BD324DRAFT_677952 [Kockovaella imperatae]|uniref:Stress-response A/B barrel domain-containing protein n=1 Tax=Kockovaella imperatae TaxID=4999 RepID=A0A1Y1UQX9_9TREE|nr:hypothetical protein BD324DRAFT_677952 [Kockovaella imperatae]ORX40488.1 hypothetical protein BD324DRAFT_677952 [Kockovaella imperatae]
MSSAKKVIITFKKGSSEEEREQVLSDVKNQGEYLMRLGHSCGEILQQDNLHSTIMPFVVAQLQEAHFGSLRYDSQGGSHSTIEHVEEDGEVRIQPV